MKKKIKDFLESLTFFENYKIVVSIRKQSDANYITITTMSEYQHRICTYKFVDEQLLYIEGYTGLHQFKTMENLFKNMEVIYND